MTTNVTCHWCGWREATDVCDEGMPSCDHCLDEVPEPPVENGSLAARVYQFIVRYPGCTFTEIREALGPDGPDVAARADRRAYESFTSIVRSNIRRGIVRTKGRRYWPVEGAVLELKRRTRRAA